MDSYDSRYPYEYYEIGTPYAFYGTMNSGYEPATAEQIAKYKDVLETEYIKNQSTSNRSNTENAANVSFHYRYVAVVIDKTHSKKSAFITVMFKNNNNGQTEYLTRRYVVASPAACYHDGDESMTVQSTTYHNHQSPNESKISGITRINNKNKTSGITRAINQTDETAGVSGITLANKNDDHISGITIKK